MLKGFENVIIKTEPIQEFDNVSDEVINKQERAYIVNIDWCCVYSECSG